MRILYVGKFWHPWSTENYVTYALRQAGVEVIKRPFTRSLTLDGLQRQAKTSKADVVLFSKPSKEWFPQFIQWCRGQEILTVVWLWDQYFGRRSQLPWSVSADLFFTTDGGHEKEWREHQVNHITLRQGIHLPESIFGIYNSPEQYKHDVGFVGHPTVYPHRKRLTEFLQAAYGNRLIIHTHTRGLELNQALARVKVIVGDSNPSPNYWSNRIYEITGRGGFLLHPITEGLDEHFTPGVHYVPYEGSNLERLKEIVDYYVNNDEEREIIRAKGFSHCRMNHTYQHRVASLLEHIRQFKQNNPSQLLEGSRLRSPDPTEWLGGV